MIICVESPCGSSDKDIFESNRLYLKRCMRYVFDKRCKPIASHALYAFSGMLDDSNPKDRALGIKAGLELNSLADEAWFFTDYGMSPGMKKALDHWISVGKDVRILSIGRNDIDF